MSERSGEWSGSESEAEAGTYKCRRETCLRDLLDLEAQFSSLRNCLYQERLSQVEARAAEVQAGRGSEYERKAAELEAEAAERAGAWEALRDFQLAEAQLRLEAETEAAHSSFENERRILVDSLADSIAARREELKAQKRSSDLSLALWLSDKGRLSPERRTAKRRKVAVVSAPVLIYRLREEEISSDWALIREASIQAELMEAQRAALSPPPPFVPPPPPQQSPTLVQ